MVKAKSTSLNKLLPNSLMNKLEKKRSFSSINTLIFYIKTLKLGKMNLQKCKVYSLKLMGLLFLDILNKTKNIGSTILMSKKMITHGKINHCNKSKIS